jgi:tetratricopeptide (TPR) repeat protein
LSRLHCFAPLRIIIMRASQPPHPHPRPEQDAARPASSGEGEAGRLRQFVRQPRNAVALLVLAAICWGGVGVWQSRATSVQRHIEAGLELSRQNQGARAEGEWKQALQIDPKNAVAWEMLGDHYATQEKWPSAREAYEHAARTAPETPRVFSRLAIAAGQAGDVGASQRFAAQALQRDPNDADALSILANLLAQSGMDDRQQLDYWRRLVKLQPQNPEYLGRAADALILKAHYEEARPLVERLRQIDPNFAPAHAMHGTILMSKPSSPASMAEAEADFRRALELEPDDTLARRALAKVLVRRKRPREAVVQLETIDRQQPATFDYLQDLATAYQSAGNPTKAAETRRRYAAIQRGFQRRHELKVRLEAQPRDFAAALELGRLLLGSRDPRGAEKYLRQAVALRPADASARAALASLERDYSGTLRQVSRALDQNKVEEAGRLLRHAFMLRPRDARTQAALAQLASRAGGHLPLAIRDLGRTGGQR